MFAKNDRLRDSSRASHEPATERRRPTSGLTDMQRIQVASSRFYRVRPYGHASRVWPSKHRRRVGTRAGRQGGWRLNVSRLATWTRRRHAGRPHGRRLGACAELRPRDALGPDNHFWHVPAPTQIHRQPVRQTSTGPPRAISDRCSAEPSPRSHLAS